jgi:hypothetical protein
VRVEEQWRVAGTKNEPLAVVIESKRPTTGAATVAPTSQTRLALRRAWAAWPTRATVQMLLLAMAILAPTFLFARHLESEHEQWDHGEHNPPRVVLAIAPSTAATDAPIVATVSPTATTATTVPVVPATPTIAPPPSA